MGVGGDYVLGEQSIQQSSAVGTAKIIALSTVQKTLIATTLIAAVGTGIYEARRASNLRYPVQALEQQQKPLADQVQQMRRQRLDAAQRIDTLQQENELLRGDLAELTRLRGDVARLRNDSQELAQLKAAGPAADNDPFAATIKAWTARMTLLKRKVAEMPDKRIPELQFLTEKNWADAAKDANLNTEDGVREAAKEFARNNNGRMPSEASPLAPYLKHPIDEATLQNYLSQMPADATLPDKP